MTRVGRAAQGVEHQLVGHRVVEGRCEAYSVAEVMVDEQMVSATDAAGRDSDGSLVTYEAGTGRSCSS
jgi:hypothetical protein